MTALMQKDNDLISEIQSQSTQGTHTLVQGKLGFSQGQRQASQFLEG